MTTDLKAIYIAVLRTISQNRSYFSEDELAESLGIDPSFVRMAVLKEGDEDYLHIKQHGDSSIIVWIKDGMEKYVQELVK